MAAGRYEVLGTSTHCEVVKEDVDKRYYGSWSLYSGGAFVKAFATKRAALQYCQRHPEL